jgi:hypothetical protein
MCLKNSDFSKISLAAKVSSGAGLLFPTFQTIFTPEATNFFCFVERFTKITLPLSPPHRGLFWASS